MTSPLKIGVAGLGTVGSALVEILQNRHDLLESRAGRPIKLVSVSAKHKNKKRDLDISNYVWYDDPVELSQAEDIEVFVELIGGDSGPAEDSVRSALAAGKHVITANKALLAKHGLSLAKEAEKNGVHLGYEAAVAGGIPIIKTLRESLAGNNVSRVYGILNGTCNYILTRMEQEQMSFEECLADAQRLGYAEADPTFDIEGYDAAHKLALLTTLAFGTEIEADSIYVEGISTITTTDIEAANELGFRIKLLGVAQYTDTGIEQRVHPTMVPKSSAIAGVSGVLNAVAVNDDLLGEIVLVGPGAGGDATASSVVGDLTDLARNTTVHSLKVKTDSLKPYKRARMRSHEGGYYIRLTVLDRPGVFASIANLMANQSISLKSIVQHRRQPYETGNPDPEDQAQSVILISHETTEEAVRTALSEIKKDKFIIEEPQMIRIEKTY